MWQIWFGMRVCVCVNVNEDESMCATVGGETLVYKQNENVSQCKLSQRV